MFSEKNISQRAVFIVTGLLALAAFVIAVKDMFFFDEDIFITQLNSAFMQQGWQRSVLVKQVFKFENILFGKAPAGYHIVSAVLHVLNAATAVILFKKLLRFFGVDKTTSLKSGAFIFFILFLFSSIHSEPLSYILAQGILLFTLFAQLSLVFFIEAAGGRKVAVITSIIFFMLSLLCYEISWMLPAVVSCMLVFGYRQSNMQRSRGIKISIVFWVVLFLWLAIKSLFISKSLVADYENITAGSVPLVTICRNAAVLFVRNFIPPAKNTFIFIAGAIVFITVLLIVMVRLRTTDPGYYRFSVMLIVLVVLSFLPAALFGIDSHDSESERYIYFSSLFAIMLLAVFLTVCFKGNTASKYFATATGILYASLLFIMLYNYKTAGNFSTKYLNQLQLHTRGAAKVYTFNQPSQFKGALMLRALTRLPQKTGDNVTVLAEYMRYMYADSVTSFITVSVAEVTKPYSQIIAVDKSIDSVSAFFPAAAGLISSSSAGNNNIAIAGLRSDTLFVFR